MPGSGERQRGVERKLDGGRLDPRQPTEVGEQAVEREVAIAEDVALANHTALIGEQMTTGPAAQGLFSSALSPGRAGPIAATDDV